MKVTQTTLSGSDLSADKPKTRSKTFMEKQPDIFYYSVGLTAFSPLACCYSLAKLNPQIKVSYGTMISLSAKVSPIQILMRIGQINVSTPVKENLNPWAAFAVIGVLQGVLYGQCNTFFAEELGLTRKSSILGMFRGAWFAAARDMISQGVPFMCSSTVRKHIIDPIIPDESLKTEYDVKHWASICTTSIVSTYVSQGLANAQFTMQANQSLSSVQAVHELWRRNGVSALYKGAEARVGLLLAINIFNDLVLKPAWEVVEVEE